MEFKNPKVCWEGRLDPRSKREVTNRWKKQSFDVLYARNYRGSLFAASYHEGSLKIELKSSKIFPQVEGSWVKLIRSSREREGTWVPHGSYRSPSFPKFGATKTMDVARNERKTYLYFPDGHFYMNSVGLMWLSEFKHFLRNIECSKHPCPSSIKSWLLGATPKWSNYGSPSCFWSSWKF